MNDSELGEAIASSVARRVDGIDRRPDAERLLSGIERRGARQRRALVGGAAVLLVIASAGGYLVGHSKDSDPKIVATNDGAPGARPESPALQPANAGVAIEEIDAAFHAAYDGTTTAAARQAAIQAGDQIERIRRETLRTAHERGYADEELSGKTIEVLTTSFVDPTHAVVHFTMSIPGRGAVLVDQVGYAVRDEGRWKVALRTACDILSLSGLGQQCPPAP